MNAQAGERIQKLLASLGVGSRRGIEQWLREGRIRVNGRVAGLGDRATAADRIELDGRELALAAPAATGELPALLLYHKPVGEVTTRSDPQGRPTVFDHLPPAPTGRWVVVGRLDVNTSGLLLFTNDGGLAHRLMHPSYEVERTYLVRVRGIADDALRQRLLAGVELEDGPARFDEVEVLERSAGHSWFKVWLREGRNREVRRLFEAAGHEVSRLKRLSYGPFDLPEDLQPARSRLLTPAVIRSALEALELARNLR